MYELKQQDMNASVIYKDPELYLLYRNSPPTTCKQIKLFIHYFFGLLPERAFDSDDLTHRWFIIGR